MKSAGVMGGKIVPAEVADRERVRLLTRRMVEGEEDAFREFHGLYGDRLFRFLLVLTRGGEDLARELCQSTMVKVVRSIDVFTEERHLWNWLTSIARNLFIDALRKRNRSPTIVPMEVVEMEREEAGAGEFEAELLNALEESLQELDFAERELVEEYYFEDRSQKSLAEEQATSRKAVESKLARVRGKMRTMLLRKLRDEK